VRHGHLQTAWTSSRVMPGSTTGRVRSRRTHGMSRTASPIRIVPYATKTVASDKAALHGGRLTEYPPTDRPRKAANLDTCAREILINERAPSDLRASRRDAVATVVDVVARSLSAGRPVTLSRPLALLKTHPGHER